MTIRAVYFDDDGRRISEAEETGAEFDSQPQHAVKLGVKQMTIAEALQARHAQPPKQRPGYVALHSFHTSQNAELRDRE
jgi:hypothetical protein